jgi:MFS family permease
MWEVTSEAGWRALLAPRLVLILGVLLVRNSFPEPFWPKVFGLLAGVWSVTVLIGPLIGGVFASYGYWRGAFVAVAGIGCLLRWFRSMRHLLGTSGKERHARLMARCPSPLLHPASEP